MKYAIERIKAQIIDLVVQTIEVDFDHKELEIVVPPSADMGDLALPCFYLAKLLRRSPNQIAANLKESLHPAGVIKSIQNVGPYLNFTLDASVLAKEVLSEVYAQKTSYGHGAKKSEKTMIEYSAPNTHKEFHVGHLRNNVLGSALVRLYQQQGFSVIPVNYIGDIGAHVAKCLWAFEKFHQDEKLPKNKGKYLGGIYSEAVKKIDEQPELKIEADETLRKLEVGDKHLTALWKKTRQWSLDEFEQIYKILGVSFKHTFFESEVEKSGKKMVADLLRDGVAVKSEGAVIINLEKYDLKNFLLLKSDGSSLYSTKDLALARLKAKKYTAQRSLYVVDVRQRFYLKQLFKTLELIGVTTPTTHVSYEVVTLKDGAMSSRSGNIIPFEDFYERVVERAQAETQKRHQDWSTTKVAKTAQAIALSAIKFNMLRVSTGNIIVFDIDEALSFDGYSGPYIQYTCSRITSVLAKAKTRPTATIAYDRLSAPLEKEMLLKLADYPQVTTQAQQANDPSVVARYVFELAQLFSTLYQQLPILTAEPAVSKARLSLAHSVRTVLTNGLAILGIETLDQM